MLLQTEVRSAICVLILAHFIQEGYAPFLSSKQCPFFDAVHVVRLGSLDGRVHIAAP